MNPLFYLIYSALDILMWLLVIWIILSWLISFRVVNISNRFVYTVYDGLGRFFEKMLSPIRRFVPPAGAIDLAPLVLFLLIQVSKYTLVYLSQ